MARKAISQVLEPSGNEAGEKVEGDSSEQPPQKGPEEVREELHSLTVKELRERARESSVDLSGKKLKADIIEAVLAAVGSREKATTEDQGPGSEEDVEHALNRLESLWVGTSTSLSKGDYKSALSFSREALGLLDGLEAQYRQEVCRRALQAAELFGARFKTSKPVKGLKSKLKEAQGAFEAGDLRACSELIHDLERDVTTLYVEEMGRLREILIEKERVLEELGAMNADPVMAHELLSNAEAALKVDDRPKALELVHEFEAVVEEARKRREENLTHYLTLVENKLKETEDLGTTLDESRMLLEQARDALEGGNLGLAAEVAQRCERTIIEMQRKHLEKAMQLRRRHYQEVRDLMAYLKPLLEEARSYGIDIENAKELAQEALDHLRKEEYYMAVEKARAGRRFLETLHPMITAERERRGIFKPQNGECHQCGSEKVRYLDDGWAECTTCGQRFTWSIRPEPWFISFLKRKLTR